MRRALALAVALVCLLVVADPAEARTGDAKDVAAAQRRANRAAARLAAAESALARADSQLDSLQRRADENRTRLEGLEGQVRQLAVRQYVQGAVPVAMFDSSDLNEMSRRQTMIRFVTVGSSDSIDAYRAAREDFVSGRAALEQSLKSRKSVVSKLFAERAAAVKDLERLAAAHRAMEARLARSRPGGARPVAAGAARVLGSGSWICPVQGPRSFSNDWGMPRSGGRRHQGNDILAPRGTPVVASVAGTVRHHRSGLGGLSYYLSGSDGNTYYGAHLQSYAAAGRVGAGTVVGYVGTSGNASGGPPHLHFEIHPGGGGAQNPYPTLSRYC